MKKLLSFAIAAIMMLSTTSAALAYNGCATVEADPKMWIAYEGFDETNWGHKYSVNYDLGLELTGVSISKAGAPANREYTGTGLSQVSFKVAVDTDVLDMDYCWGMGDGLFADSTVDQNYNDSQLTFVWQTAQTDPTKFKNEGKGTLAWFVVMPKDEDSFDPAALKMEIVEGCIFVMGYNAAKATAPTTWTSYSNLSSKDYELDCTMGVEVLKDYAVDGKQIVADTKNVEGVTAATTVTVSYEGTEKEYGNFGDLLGIEGDGTAEGTVRFAVLCSDTLDPNGFLFKIN